MRLTLRKSQKQRRRRVKVILKSALETVVFDEDIYKGRRIRPTMPRGRVLESEKQMR
jgi:hypothetical protein